MGYAVGNVVSSVALVLLNKRVFSGGFVYPMTLSCFHFAFTIVFYQLLAAFNVFQKPAIDMPQKEKFKVAAAGFASIGFMNLSLSTNSVGFYQITKLVIIPVTLAINYYGLSGTQLQSSIAPWQTMQAMVVAGSTEMVCWSAQPCVTTVDYFSEASEPTHSHTLMLVLGTCFLALLVNWCSFGLIGRTSPITFQV